MKMVHSNDDDHSDDNGKRELSMVLKLEAITFHLQNRALFYYNQIPSWLLSITNGVSLPNFYYIISRPYHQWEMIILMHSKIKYHISALIYCSSLSWLFAQERLFLTLLLPCRQRLPEEAICFPKFFCRKCTGTVH